MKRFAAIAAILVALIAPVQAQTFSFGTPDGYSFSFGSSGFREHRPAPRTRPEIDHCMRYGAVIEFVRSSGYRNVRPYDDRGHTVRVLGEQRGRIYIVTVDPCRARIVGRDRVRSSPRGRDWNRY